MDLSNRKNVQTPKKGKDTYKDILFFQKEKEFHQKLLDNTIHLEQRKGSHQASQRLLHKRMSQD